MKNYDIAQICMSGHIINDSVNRSPEDNKNFCDECGEPTIQACQNCKSNIQGAFYNEGDYDGYGAYALPLEKLPAFCPECGTKYPWTESALISVEKLIKELENLDEDDRSKLISIIPDLLGSKETPKTKVAVPIFKKLMDKAGKQSYEVFKSILYDMVGEFVKRQLFY